MKLICGLALRALLVFALMALLIFKVDAQVGGAPVTVNVAVMPPYSNLAKDYVQQGNNVMITLTNLQSVPQQVIVLPSISGNNGVKAALRPDYMPPAGLLLGPNQTRMITLNQLKAINNTVSPADIIVQQITKEDYLNNAAIPEGLYTVCATVKNFAVGTRWEAQGCATFLINSYDPPIILNPAGNATIKPVNPQFISFGWTPSGIAGKTRYSFKLVDLTSTPINDPNDAFLNNNVQPLYQQTNILTNNLVLDNSKPKLKEGNKYALQVIAYDPQHKMAFKNKGKSQVIVFTYKNTLGLANNPGDNPPQNDPPPGDCASATKWNGTLKNTNKNGIPNGVDIAVGHFVMKNTVFTQSNGSYSGTGEILVSFLNTRLKVEFSGIKIGDDNRVFAGKITAKPSPNTGINDAMAKDRTGTLTTVGNINQLKIYLEDETRNVKDLNPISAPLELPVYIAKNNRNSGVVGMIFEPTEAYANMVMIVEMPQATGDNNVLLSNKGIPVQPNGFATTDVRLFVPETKTLWLSQNKLSLVLSEGANNSYASIDCKGFKEFGLKGSVQLDRSLAIPYQEGSEYVMITDPKVKVGFPFMLPKLTSFEDLIINDLVSSTAFAIPDASDFVFKTEKVSFDLSSSKHADGFETAFKDLKDKKDWIGIFIKDLELALPTGFKGGPLSRVFVNGANMNIGKMGINYERTEKDILKNGNIAGWKLNLEKFTIKITNSKLSNGSLAGSVDLPIGDNAELEFEATIKKGDENGAEIEMNVETADDINASLFLAKLKLEKGSTVTLTKKNKKYEAKAVLNGEISISFDKKPAKSNVSAFEMPKLKFEELTVTGKDENGFVPAVDMKFVELSSQTNLQANIGAFELSLNEISFKKKDNRVGLGLNLGLSLFGGANDSKNGAGASAGFTIWAKYENKKFKYDESKLDEIAIKADLGAAYLEGSINIYDQDEVYGNGFRGAVTARLNGIGAAVGVTVQFGRTLSSKGNYKYWYFDAMAEFPDPGLNIPGTVASIYGFGGGAWCNMTRSGNTSELKPGSYKPVSKGGDKAPTTSGAVFVPKKDEAGFFAAIMFGITGSKSAFNGDLKFSMALNSKTLSVNNVKLEGHAYLMQDPSNVGKRDPGKAFLYCDALIEYDKPTNKISGNFGAHINVLGIIEGGGDVAFKFDMPDRDQNGTIINPNQKTSWFIKCGMWTPGVDPFDDEARLHAKIGFDAKVVKAEIKFQSYFMVGNDLPSTLPPIPTYIYNLVKDEGMEKTKAMPASVSDGQNLAFAFGAGLKLTAGFDFFVVKASLEAAAGFDVLISDINGTCDGKEIGFNGWYAQGQAYAYLRGDLKLFRRVTLAEFVAGAVFQVKLPNPNWVRGDLVVYIDVLGIDAGEYHGTFERGTACSNMKTEFEPFEGVKLVKSVTPVHGTKDVSPFTNTIQVNLTYGNGLVTAYDAYNDWMRMYTHHSEIKLLDANKKEVPFREKQEGDYPYKKFRLVPKETLLGKANYTVVVDAWISDGDGKKVRKEHVEVKFTTGSRPVTFGIADMYESYPFPNQRYFMKKKVNGEPEKGLLAMRKDLAYIFDAIVFNQPTPNAGMIKPFIRFVEVGTGVAIDVPAIAYTSDQYDAPTAKAIFDIPQGLKNSTIYELQVVRKLVPLVNMLVPKLEIPVFDGLYFRTSGYNSFKEKIDGYSVKKTGYIPYSSSFSMTQGNKEAKSTGQYYVPVLLLEGEENFDRYEMFTYTYKLSQYEEQSGKLLHMVGNGPISNWRSDQYQVHGSYVNSSLSQPEKDHLYKMSQKCVSNWKWVEKPAEFPYNGIRAEALSASGTIGAIQWMKNIQQYESILRKRNDLTGSESIRRPDDVLTADEVSQAKSGIKIGNGLMGGSGNKSGGNSKQYSAIVDFTPVYVNYDIFKLKVRLLNGSLKVSGSDFWKTYNILNKLGWSAYKKQNYDIELIMAHPGGGSSGLKKFTFKYDPQ